MERVRLQFIVTELEGPTESWHVLINDLLRVCKREQDLRL